MYKRYGEYMELRQASEYGVLNPMDIQAVVTRLNGVYAAGDVYERYREQALQCGRIPAHKTRVGQWLVRAGYPRRKSRGRTLYMFWV